jgi:putative membrane protein
MSEPTNRNVTDHLANERTFLAWVRTGIGVVVFGFAIGRFGIALRQFSNVSGVESHGTGLSLWFGTASIVLGLGFIIAGLVSYQRTRHEIDAGTFRPATWLMTATALLTLALGGALALYLLYAGHALG